MSYTSLTTYNALRNAIIDRKQIVCRYNGFVRECCPHAIGATMGERRVFVYQFAGGSSSGLPVGGEWRCMTIDDMAAISVREGPWHTGTRHSKKQTCIKAVDLDITTG